MKKIADLQIQLYNKTPLPISEQNKKGLTYSENQFDSIGSEKNILFVDTQLSGRHLYRFILPALGMKSSKINTAFTDLWKYNQKDQLIGLHIDFNINRIVWANFIVLPFTTEDLTPLYQWIKKINMQCEIVYCVDFNYYELSDKHPYKELFTEEAIYNIEKNIWFSDITMVTNMPFRDYLVEKMQELISTKMNNIHTNAFIACIPYFIDTEIVLGNVAYNIQTPTQINPPVEREPENKKQLDIISPPTQKSVVENKKQIRVLYEGGNWVLKKGATKKAIEVYAKKAIAIEKSNKWAKKGYDIIIYNMAGVLQSSIIFEHQKN